MPIMLDSLIAARNAEMAAKFDAAPDKQLAIDPAHYLDQVLAERAPIYADHLAKMDLAPEVTLWAMAMAKKYGSYVKCWHFICDWPTALLILRYGEEPDPAKSEPRIDGSAGGWPMAFSADDMARAAQLLKGEKWPADIFTLLGA